MLHAPGIEGRRFRRRVWLRAMIGEFICTFIFFVSVMGANLNFTRLNVDPSTSIVANALVSAFAAIGIVYSFADISGAHFNPAVTFSTWVSRKTSNRKSLSFIVLQLFASVLAVFILMLAFPPQCSEGKLYPNGTCTEYESLYHVAKELVVEPPDGVSLGHVFAMEFILTFFFLTVIFMTVFANIEEPMTKLETVADSRGLTLYTTTPRSKTGFAPLAIGITIGFLSFVGGSVSGGIFNPARLFGPALVSGQWYGHIWLYFLGEITGAVAAAMTARLLIRLGKDPGAESQPLISIPATHDESA